MSQSVVGILWRPERDIRDAFMIAAGGSRNLDAGDLEKAKVSKGTPARVERRTWACIFADQMVMRSFSLHG